MLNILTKEEKYINYIVKDLIKGTVIEDMSFTSFKTNTSSVVTPWGCRLYPNEIDEICKEPFKGMDVRFRKLLIEKYGINDGFQYASVWSKYVKKVYKLIFQEINKKEYVNLS